MELQEAALVSENSLEAELSLLEEEYFEGRESHAEDESSGMSSDNDGDPDRRSPPNTWTTEIRELDKEEEENVRQFSETTCGCSKKQGSPCSSYFTQVELAEIRMSMAELERDQLDLVILAQINAHHYAEEVVGHRTEAEKLQRVERAKDYTTFFYRSHSICLKTFLFVHNIGKKRFRNLIDHYRLNGVSPRMHGNVKRRPWNAAAFADKERAVTFIKNFAEVHSIPLLGRMPKFYDYNIMLLPTDASKASVHRDYVKAMEALGETSQQSLRCFGYREFCRLWSEVVPYIRVSPPADDLCFVCQENATFILKAANLSEDEKNQRLFSAQQHLERAKIQRNYYREQVKSSKLTMEKITAQEGNLHANTITLSYSFDHAQQVHYPSNPQQPGPLYFKTPRKCGIFGVCSEGNNTQLNYLIDEAQSCGKGANTIVSMVHHYLHYFTFGEESISLQADNCVGQNKNNTMVSYLAWRVMVGLNKSCELNFMIPGHTKFSPDRFFGLIKRKYRCTRLSSLAEIAEVVEGSTSGGQNRAYIIGDEQSSKPFHYCDWAEFLSALFMPVPLITSYYHFRFSHTQPGVVFVREFADSEEKKIIIIRSGTTIDKSALPVTLTPSGLSQERKQYLFEHIRPFCDEEYRNITCPEPRAQKRPNSQEQGPSTKRSKRLCSHCRMPGHTKTVKGEITCPTLLKECPQ